MTTSIDHREQIRDLNSPYSDEVDLTWPTSYLALNVVTESINPQIALYGSTHY